MAKRAPDWAGEAFRRLSEDAQPTFGVVPPDRDRLVDWAMVALGAFVLAFVGMGILALFTEWPP
jgi:hypothetical protein